VLQILLNLTSAKKCLECLKDYKLKCFFLTLGDLVGTLCKNGGCQAYVDIREAVFDGIRKNLDNNDECSHDADHHYTLSLCKSSSNEVNFLRNKIFK